MHTSNILSNYNNNQDNKQTKKWRSWNNITKLAQTYSLKLLGSPVYLYVILMPQLGVSFPKNPNILFLKDTSYFEYKILTLTCPEHRPQYLTHPQNCARPSSQTHLHLPQNTELGPHPCSVSSNLETSSTSQSYCP